MGVTGRLWVVGGGWMTRWGLCYCAENHGVGERGNRHTVCERKHCTHTRNPGVGRPGLPPPQDSVASLRGLTRGPHSLGACRLGKFPKGSGLRFLIC